MVSYQYVIIATQEENMIARLIGRFISSLRPSRNTARAVIFHNDEIFLVKHRLSGNGWSIPGGGLEEGELPHEALKRELYEELGIRDFEFEEQGQIEYLSTNQVINSTIYRVEIKNREMKVDWFEIKKHGWFKLSELPDLVGPAQEAILLCEKNV